MLMGWSPGGRQNCLNYYYYCLKPRGSWAYARESYTSYAPRVRSLKLPVVLEISVPAQAT